jgi:phosphoribosylformimino-5-aminoimidazole carboxamide ribotide isomerase
MAVRVIPVLDLLKGVVVHGVAGQRDQYRPIQSCLTESSEPLEVARVIRRRFGFHTLYIADLDGIISGAPRFDLHRLLLDDGFRLMIDAGARAPADVHRILALGAESIIGLESWDNPESLDELEPDLSAGRVIFSLDLKHGQAQCGPNWPDPDPLAIAGLVAAKGLTRRIVLDVAAVGTRRGVPTLGLCRQLAERFPRLQLITGGGIRTQCDVRGLDDEPLEGVLIATALHNGAMG